MSRHLLFCMFFIGACSSAKQHRPGSFVKGLKAFHQANHVEARRQFEGLRIDHNLFVLGLTENQKLNYQEGRWDQFFGQSFYYRNVTLKKARLKDFNQRLLVLEVLALARHCRFKEAAQVARWGVTLGNRLQNRPVNELEKSIELFAFNSSISERNTKKPIPKKGHFYQDLAWSMSPKQLASLSNPRDLRVKVRSHCL